MNTDRYKIQTVRLTRRDWKLLAENLPDEFWDTRAGQDLLVQLQIGVARHPASFPLIQESEHT